MQNSLDQLAALPGNTLVCCAHEYTISNLRFAQAVEPNNQHLAQYLEHCQALRSQGQPTLPSTLQIELAINPFMRSRAADVIAAAVQHDSHTGPKSPPACWQPCANGKTFLMKLLHTLLLSSVLVITGCATTSSVDPMYPNGPLKPLGQGRIGNSEVASLEATGDLWTRIRGGFGMPDLEQDLVQDQEQWYASRPDYIQRMTERSSKYLFHIVEELERRGMPSELALLPFIESAFNPQAVSSAKAAGMWQFMPATGTYFDLKQNIFRDDRRDVLASTRAALDYLQKLYGMFGDWHLALAAYNWGEGSVGRAIKRNEKLGLPTGYTDLQMPAETRNYVPKLQAVKNIVAHPERFNAELPVIENHPYFQAVTLPHDIDVELVAKLADVSVKDFKALNPSFHKPVIFARATPQILLPWDNAKVFRRNLQAYTDGQFASWTVWTVPTTITVTEAAQRTGLSETDLRSINNIPPRMLIKAGSALMVPRDPSIKNDVPGHIADNGQISFAPK